MSRAGMLGLMTMFAALASTDPYGKSFGTPRRQYTKEEELRHNACDVINSFTPEQREEAMKWDHKRFTDEPLNQYELRMEIRKILRKRK